MSLLKKIVPFSGNSWIFVRHYAFKPELPIKWVRPEKICCTRPEKSGDMAPSPPVDLSLPVTEYRDCKSLEEADETVKKLFSLESFPGKKTGHHLRNIMREEVQRHPLDVGSMEALIADQTARIRRLQEIFAAHPRNRVLKVYLKELIDKRKCFLKYMRRWDYRRFEWLLEKLDIVYKAHPAEYVLVGRKYAIRKLTDSHCNEIRENKLEDYRKELESQQVEFLEKKIKNLEFIKKEQETLKLPQTVTEEQINQARQKLSQAIMQQKATTAASKGH
ncbi:28S ribosomal protein S15, mitochondrial [Phlebotomus papatasi]|uniref:28S ribosomal protein S15, mitochondrial n=1 Tax=Phlebotomus papatasi TaxID=29031 RepID=UPI0024841317|nr:28S ribosomal protein S15, mitochondrial [Phlebotomus papatasi]XP_055702295.1 28S ribosomal protein S15, mitochondrial [Phlebotomus papatasi]XP_055702296.1 28S ribosomal protein S15, mitochondrial [Phlebotomus papatasi]